MRHRHTWVFSTGGTALRPAAARVIFSFPVTRPFSAGNLCAAIGCFALFAFFGAWPAPDSNESAYLPQAKHYGDPKWCPGDLFLDAPPPHRLFCRVVGAAAPHVSLTTLAWLGRGATWMFMAAGFAAMARTLRLSPPATLRAVCLFMIFSYLGQFAGEWTVGGFESKGIAWGFVWFAVASRLRGRTPAAIALAGIAGAWHILVGGWTLTALFLTIRPRELRVSPVRWAAGLGVAAAAVGVGILPALKLNANAPQAVIDEAARIYVFECCPFHLLPEGLNLLRLPAFAAQLALWFALGSAIRRRPAPRLQTLRRLVNAALGIAVAGLVLRGLTIAEPNLTARIMRFYWFRLADGLVPLGTAFTVAYLLDGLDRRPRRPRTAAARSVTLLIVVLCAVLAIYRAVVTHPRSENQLEHPADFATACEWIRTSTPHDAVVLSPPNSQTMHWRGERAEVATWKDLPHDAVGIVAWRGRIAEVQEAFDLLMHASTTYDRRTAADALTAVARKYGATYVVCRADPPLPLERLGPKGFYAIYRVAPPAGADAEGVANDARRR